jgi:hypothetical protein
LPGVPRPSPCFLDDSPEVERLGAYGGRLRWRSRERKQLYEWDSTHGEIEVYNLRGRHLGAAEPVLCILIKPADKRKRIDV